MFNKSLVTGYSFGSALRPVGSVMVPVTVFTFVARIP